MADVSVAPDIEIAKTEGAVKPASKINQWLRSFGRRQKDIEAASPETPIIPKQPNTALNDTEIQEPVEKTQELPLEPIFEKQKQPEGPQGIQAVGEKPNPTNRSRSWHTAEESDNVASLREEATPREKGLLEEQGINMSASESSGEQFNSNEYVERKLNARVETDDAGFDRKIYSLNGVTFSFRGREELPVFPTLTQSKDFLLGENPRYISVDESKTYQAQVTETQTHENSPQHLLATKTLMGVVELAVRLGSKDATLPQLKEELSRGIYSERARSLIDALVAANYVRDNISSEQTDIDSVFEENHNNNAEALVLLAILGDTQAQGMAEQKTEAMKRFGSKTGVGIVDKVDAELPTMRSQLGLEEEKVEPIDLKDLVCVHATRYPPSRGVNGEFVVPTTFDATKGNILMNTIHTYLNSKVNSHNYGSWKDAGYVIISPMESMIQDNGLPTVLHAADTFWARDPGEPLVFSDAVLVMPGEDQVKGLYTTEGNIIRFKSENLGIEDLISLATSVKKPERLQALSTNLNQDFGESFGWLAQIKLPEWDLAIAYDAIVKYLYPGQSRFAIADNDPALLKALTQQGEDGQVSSLEEGLLEILNKSGAMTGIKPEVSDKGVAAQKLIDNLSDKVRSVMFTQINGMAVDEAINAKGFQVREAGDRGWEGVSREVDKKFAALGAQLGVPVALHVGTYQNQLTEELHGDQFGFKRGALRAAYIEEDGIEKFDWKEYSPEGRIDNLIPKLDPKTRRVLYASGYLTSRK